MNNMQFAKTRKQKEKKKKKNWVLDNAFFLLLSESVPTTP
jgi:hypothetical protein